MAELCGLSNWRGQQQPQALQQQQQQAPPPQQPVYQERQGVNQLGVNTDLPKHPEYAIESSRLLTYRTWRGDMPQPADVLCRAGFYYTGE